VAFAISTVTSTGGVSGAFLILPFQMSVLGFTSPAVSATNHLYNVVAIPGGLTRYVREGRMLWPLAWTFAAGAVPGVIVGTLVRVRWLPEPRPFEIFASLVLLWAAGQTALGLLGPRGRRRAGGRAPAREAGAGGVRSGDAPDRDAGWTLTAVEGGPREATFAFRGETWSFRPPTVFVLALVVGVVGGVYGIGGGAIIAPFVVTFFGLPVHAVAGAALFGTLLTSLVGVLSYQALAPLHPGLPVAPDWALGALFGLGGLIGTWCGARMQRHVPDRAIRWMLALVLLFLGVRYALP
jgi:uncharacterized membrane protein YfcA